MWYCNYNVNESCDFSRERNQDDHVQNLFQGKSENDIRFEKSILEGGFSRHFECIRMANIENIFYHKQHKLVRVGNSNLKTSSCDKLWHFVSLNSTQAVRALMDDVVTIQ